MFKNGTNLNRMENRAVKRNFYYIYQNSNMHKKVDMLNPVNSDWGYMWITINKSKPQSALKMSYARSYAHYPHF